MPKIMIGMALYWLCIFRVFASSVEVIVEPPMWWVGMAQPKLQLLLRGKDIGAATIQLQQYPNVKMLSQQSVANSDYLFVNLLINEGAATGQLQFKITWPDGQESILSYALGARKKASAARKGFDNSDVIYLINPDRFANGDVSNDTQANLLEGVTPTDPDGRHGGDIAGIIQHLDYLAQLGVTQLWLTPVLENNHPKYSYHGYAITDFYQVDGRMGSNEAYRTLSLLAQKQGMGLVMDMVLNHSGSHHWWVSAPPTPDWLNPKTHLGQFSATSHARQTIQDPHASSNDKRAFSDGWFVPDMADLNQRQPLLAQYLIQNAIWWVEYADLSGIRVDTYSYSDKTFLTEWTKALLDEYPQLGIVGEEWSTNPAIASYWQQGKHNHDGYESYLPSVMDFSLQQAVIEGLQEPESWNTGLIKIYQSLANDFLYPHPEKLLVFADNHDMSRVFTSLKQDVAKTKMALGLLLTTRGIAQLYYGSEILLDNTPSDAHGVIRADFPGGFAHHTVNAFTGQGLTPAQKDMQQWLTQLLNFRKQQPVLHQGDLMHFSPQNGVYVYFRYNDDQSLMMILNNNARALTLELSRFNERLIGYRHYQSPLQLELKGDLDKPIELSPNSFTLLQLQQ